MIASKPILVSRGTFAADVVAETGCGAAADYSADSVLAAAGGILADPEAMRKCSTAGRKAFEGRYNWPAMEKVLLKAYADLLTE
jgi:glycosyltransferase involved in cell wall biosynthesis